MRELAILTFQTLDGVMQAPRLPDEDTSGGFNGGGWGAPYWEDVMEQVGKVAMAAPYDVLLGRKTYQLFAANFSAEGDEHPMKQRDQVRRDIHPERTRVEEFRSNHRRHSG